MAVTHAFTSAKADGGDTTLVQPSNWNANHTITSVPASGVISTTDATAASSKTVGSIVAAGGIAASGALWCDTIVSAGTGTPATFSNAEFITYDTYAGLLQVVAQNLSANAAASTDFVATCNTGTDTTGYVNLGINGSAYSVGTWTINGATDGYEFCAGGNHAIGTDTSGKNLVLFTGGTLAANARLTLTDALATFSGPVTFSSTINKVTVTAPATSATLTLVTGSTLQTTGAFTLNLTTTADSTPTFPTGAGTLTYLSGANTWTGAQTFNTAAATFALTDVHTLGHVLTASASVATAGYLGYNSTQLSHEFFSAGLKTMNTGTIYTATADGTNGAATTITSIIGTGVGTRTTPTLWSATAGKTIRIKMTGTVTTAAAPGTCVITLRMGSVAVATCASTTLTASMTNMGFAAEFLITVRSATTVIGGGTITVCNVTTGLTTITIPVTASAVATIVSATTYLVDVASTNGTASGTIWTTRTTTVEVLN